MIGHLSGYLLASPAQTDVARRALAPGGSNARVSLEFIGPFENTRFWEEYLFHSDRAFVDDDAGTIGKPPYRYPVYCARSGSKLIILSEKKRLTDYVIQEALNKSIFPNLRHVNIQTEKMIGALEDTNGPYRLTSLHGRFSGAGRDLRTMILYGPQVTNSAVFRDHRHLFNFYICGIADRSPDDPFVTSDDGEIARVGNDGSIGLQVFNRRRATDLNRMINYLISNKWVDDWVSSSAGETE